MTKLLAHARTNAVAYVALFIALGGTGYAAVTLPAASVGTRQLRDGAVTARKLANGSITPVKLDERAVGGTVRHWAHIGRAGQVVAGSYGSRASVGGNQFTISWGTRMSSRCAFIVTAAAVPGIAPIADSAGVGVGNGKSSQTASKLFVWTYSHDAPIAAPFNIVVIC